MFSPTVVSGSTSISRETGFMVSIIDCSKCTLKSSSSTAISVLSANGKLLHVNGSCIRLNCELVIRWTATFFEIDMLNIVSRSLAGVYRFYSITMEVVRFAVYACHTDRLLNGYDRNCLLNGRTGRSFATDPSLYSWRVRQRQYTITGRHSSTDVFLSVPSPAEAIFQLNARWHPFSLKADGSTDGQNSVHVLYT